MHILSRLSSELEFAFGDVKSGCRNGRVYVCVVGSAAVVASLASPEVAFE
jgi:hypothetical protein